MKLKLDVMWQAFEPDSNHLRPEESLFENRDRVVLQKVSGLYSLESEEDLKAKILEKRDLYQKYIILPIYTVRDDDE